MTWSEKHRPTLQVGVGIGEGQKEEGKERTEEIGWV